MSYEEGQYEVGVLIGGATQADAEALLELIHDTVHADERWNGMGASCALGKWHDGVPLHPECECGGDNCGVNRDD